MSLFLIIFILTNLCFARQNPNVSKKPLKPAKTCVIHNGEGAKKTYIALYQFAQDKKGINSTESIKDVVTTISTPQIFCKAFVVGLPKVVEQAVQILSEMDSGKFQCAYYVTNRGTFEACHEAPAP